MELSEKQRSQAIETRKMFEKVIMNLTDYPPRRRGLIGKNNLYYQVKSAREGNYRIRCYSNPISKSAHRNVPSEDWFIQHGNSDMVTDILNRAAATDMIASIDGRLIYFLEQMRDNIECLHRADGPAYCIYDENSGEPIEVKYFLKGNEYTEEEYNRIINTSGALAFMGASPEQVRAKLAKETEQVVNSIENRKLSIRERGIDRFEVVN